MIIVFPIESWSLCPDITLGLWERWLHFHPYSGPGSSWRLWDTGVWGCSWRGLALAPRRGCRWGNRDLLCEPWAKPLFLYGQPIFSGKENTVDGRFTMTENRTYFALMTFRFVILGTENSFYQLLYKWMPSNVLRFLQGKKKNLLKFYFIKIKVRFQFTVHPACWTLLPSSSHLPDSPWKSCLSGGGDGDTGPPAGRHGAPSQGVTSSPSWSARRQRTECVRSQDFW